MGWRDTLQTASFRGVLFYYESVSSTVGRRTVVHEYAGRDDAEVEDLGRKAAEFMLDAFVIGPDYDIDRDKLIDAFETEGPGQLVHPYWGARTVAIISPVSIKESPKSGGMARLSVKVIEVSTQAATFRRTADTAANLDTAATAAATAMSDDFEDEFTTVDLIEQAVDNAETAVEAGFTALRDAKGNVNAALNIVDTGLAAIQQASEAVADIINLPGDLIDAVKNRIAQVFASISTIGVAADALLSLGDDEELPYSDGATSQAFRSELLMATWRAMDEFDAAGATVLGDGAQSEIEEANLAAIINAFVAGSTIEAARAISEITFDSFDRAFEVLEELSAALDTLAENASGDTQYQAFVKLRAMLALHIQATAATLPRIVYPVPHETSPALVIAQQLYGDPDMAEDIIKRNLSRNPAAILGGVAIEALSND